MPKLLADQKAKKVAVRVHSMRWVEQCLARCDTGVASGRPSHHLDSKLLNNERT